MREREREILGKLKTINQSIGRTIKQAAVAEAGHLTILPTQVFANTATHTHKEEQDKRKREDGGGGGGEASIPVLYSNTKKCLIDHTGGCVRSMKRSGRYSGPQLFVLAPNQQRWCAKWRRKKKLLQSMQQVIAFETCRISADKLMSGRSGNTVETRFYVFFRQRRKIRKNESYVKSNLVKSSKYWRQFYFFLKTFHHISGAN